MIYEILRNNELFYDTASTIDSDSNIGGLNRTNLLNLRSVWFYGMSPVIDPFIILRRNCCAFFQHEITPYSENRKTDSINYL